MIIVDKGIIEKTVYEIIDRVFRKHKVKILANKGKAHTISGEAMMELCDNLRKFSVYPTQWGKDKYHKINKPLLYYFISPNITVKLITNQIKRIEFDGRKN